MGRIFSPGDPVIARGRNDELLDAGEFVGVNEYGQAIIRVTVRTRHNGRIIGVDTYDALHSMSALYHKE